MNREICIGLGLTGNITLAKMTLHESFFKLDWMMGLLVVDNGIHFSLDDGVAKTKPRIIVYSI